jgi:hypothetical protein
MSQYRDEREALRARLESLEQELAAATSEVTELRAEGPAAERIERLTQELADAERELARFRGGAPPPRVPVFFGGAAGSIGVAILATLWLFGAELGNAPCGASRGPTSVQLVPLPGAELANGADLPQPPAACPRVSASGHVADATGATDVDRWSTCDVGVIPLGGECKVRVRCAGEWLFDGFARVMPDGRVVDDRPSTKDLDPRVVIDARAGRAEVSDETETGEWSVEIDFSGDG